jgi:hypothetical protein
MASEETGEPTGQGQRESWIDEFIRDIFEDGGTPTKAPGHGGDHITTLVEKVIQSVSSTAPQASAIEKLLLAQAFATALADALAPALAELLAPEIMKALEQYGGDSNSGRETASATSRTNRAKGNRRGA